MALIDKIFISGSWVDSAARLLNVTGTPLVSAADASTGEAIADIYGLAISAVASGACTVTVSTTSPNNPYKGRVATGVLIDGATQYKNIIPGITLVFSNTAANGNAATVTVGLYMGTFDAFGGGAGVPSASTRHQVINTGSGAVANSKAQCLTQAVLYRKTGSGIFNYVRPFAVGATEKQAGGGSTRTMPYHITVANVTGAGSSKVCDLQVDGVTLGADSLLNLSTGLTEDGAGIKAITPAYPYRIVTGPLTGVEFAIDASVGSGDTANILIFPSRYVQIAPDVAGSAGTWGVTDINLTQSGQATGVIQPAGDAYYHSRVVVPAGSGAESNPHPTNVALSGTETGSADWAG